MQASQITRGQTIVGHGVVTAIQTLHRSVVFYIHGGGYLQVLKTDNLATLPARDARGRFLARVILVLSYCAELGDIVTTHLGVKAARRAVALHLSIWPNGQSAVV